MSRNPLLQIERYEIYEGWSHILPILAIDASRFLAKALISNLDLGSRTFPHLQPMIEINSFRTPKCPAILKTKCDYEDFLARDPIQS